jgi:molecular chaperone DnaJ
VEQHKEVEARIPPGVETGSRLRLQGEGEAGPNGGPSGDLYVVILVREHPDFERQAANLYATLPITFSQAALGADLPVKTLNGPQELKIPAGTQTGTVFRMRGQGMPVLGGHGRGDLFIAVTVVTPKNLTREQRKLLEDFAAIEGDEAGFMDKVRDIFS